MPSDRQAWLAERRKGIGGSDAASWANITCQDATVSATMAIDTMRQVWEDDVIAILHAVEAAIRRSGNTHIDRWKFMADELASHQRYLAEEVEADRTWRGEL